MDVLIAASAADDPVATKLFEEFERRGKRPQLLDGVAAARLFTVRSGDAGDTVTPHVPIFLRGSAWWTRNEPTDDDERFLRSEAWSTLWAATALTSAPVVNRPGPDGYNGRMTGVASRDEDAAGIPGRAEVFADRASVIRSRAGWWGEDLVSFRSAPVDDLGDDSPVRARPVQADATYEIVTVVGDRGMAATLDPSTASLELEARSVQIVRGLGLAFATVTWSVDRSGTATVARVNHSPTVAELRFRWRDVVDALCLELLPCS